MMFHDPDSPNDERDPGDRSQHQGEDPGRLRRAAQDVLLAEDLEVGLGRIRDVVPVE